MLHLYSTQFIVLYLLPFLLFFMSLVVYCVLFKRIWQPHHLGPFVVTFGCYHAVFVVSSGVRRSRKAFDMKTLIMRQLVLFGANKEDVQRYFLEVSYFFNRIKSSLVAGREGTLFAHVVEFVGFLVQIHYSAEILNVLHLFLVNKSLVHILIKAFSL